MSKQKRKSSPLQIVAAQNNGAKSRGPITPEGRAASARNAARHNMCSKALVLTIEEQAAFAEHQKNYFDQFQPVGEIEFGLVTDMVVAKWRQWRLWTVETALYDLQMDKQMKQIDETFDSIDNATRLAVAFQALADDSKALALLLRYETSMRRMHEKCLKTLMELQSARNEHSNEPSAAPPDAPPDTAHTEPRPPGSELTPINSTRIQELRNEPGGDGGAGRSRTGE